MQQKITSCHLTDMKKTLSTILVVFLAMVGKAQTASVMAIHNSPDPALDSVDMYLLDNGTATLLKNNFAFRTATGFINAPAERPIRIVFAGKSSLSIADSVIGFGFNLPNNGKFILIAQGHFQNGFAPQQPFELKVIANAETSKSGTDNKILVYHGSTDAPTVDISAFVKTSVADPTYLAEDASYGDNTAYLTVPNADYFINVSLPNQAEALFTYAAPLKTLNVGGEPIVAFASGFLDPSKNLNGKAFGLFAVLSSGAVVELPLQTTAKLQIIHNSPDALASTVDIYTDLSGSPQILLDNFAYRKATPFLSIPANTNFTVWIAPANSTSIAQSIYNMDLNIPGGAELIAVAQGVIDTSKYENAANIGFDLIGYVGTVSALEAGKVTLGILHGSTDAPAVDVRVGGASGPLLTSGLVFGDISDPITTNPTDIVVSVLPAGASTVVASYNAPLSAFKDSAITVLASGFLSPNVPAGKDAGQGFGLFAVTAAGRVIALPLNTTSVNSNSIHNDYKIYPNPATSYFEVESIYKIVKVVLSTVDGKLVSETRNSSFVNTDDLNKGLYLVTIYSENGVFNTTLVK